MAFVKKWSSTDALERKSVLEDRTRTGRPRLLTPEQVAEVPKMLKRRATRTSYKVAKKLNVSPRTIQKIAHKTMRWKRRVKKCSITRCQKLERLSFAIAYNNGGTQLYTKKKHDATGIPRGKKKKGPTKMVHGLIWSCGWWIPKIWGDYEP